MCFELCVLVSLWIVEHQSSKYKEQSTNFKVQNTYFFGAPTETRTLNRGLKVRYVASYAIGAWSRREDSNLHHSLIWRLQGISLPHCLCATPGYWLAAVTHAVSLRREMVRSLANSVRYNHARLERPRGLAPRSTEVEALRFFLKLWARVKGSRESGVCVVPE